MYLFYFLYVHMYSNFNLAQIYTLHSVQIRNSIHLSKVVFFRKCEAFLNSQNQIFQITIRSRSDSELELNN